MGLLNNEQIVVDAVLSKKGRQYLAENSPSFKITKFALADDGVDYTLYNPEHLSGSDYYGANIENMPNLEAISDESQTMKYKLITLPKGTPKIPILSVQPTSVTMTAGQEVMVTITTTNSSEGFNNRTYGFTAILDNNLICKLDTVDKAPGQVNVGTITTNLNNTDESVTETAVGLTFKLTAKNVQTLSDSQLTGKLIIVGNETGGNIELPITVNKS